MLGMKFEVSKDALQNNLIALQSASNGKAKKFWFAVEKEGIMTLSVSFSDGILVSSTVELESSIPKIMADAIAVPFRVLDVLKTLAGLDVQVIVLGDEDGKSVRFSIDNENRFFEFEAFASPCIAHSLDYEKTKTTSVDSKEFIDGLNAVSFCTVKDVLRPDFGGVKVAFEEDVCDFVATCGEFLGIAKATPAATATGNGDWVWMPKKAVKALNHLISPNDSDVEISYDLEATRIKTEGFVLSFKTISCFPNHKEVVDMAQANSNRLIVERGHLLSCMRRMALLANSNTYLVRLKLESPFSELKAFVDFPNKATEALHCSYEGKAMEINLSAKHLYKILKNMKSEMVHIKIGEPDKPILIQSGLACHEQEHVKILLMPIIMLADG